MSQYCYLTLSNTVHLTCYIVIGTLLLLALSLLLMLLLIHKTYSEELLQAEGVTTVTNPIPRFWYKTVGITQTVHQYDYNHLLSVVKIKCDELIHHTLDYWFESRSLEATNLVRNVGQRSYLYMLKDSAIEYTICLKSLMNHTEATIRYFIFDNDIDFANYQAKLEDGEKAIRSMKFTAGNEISCFRFNFVASSSNFYFFVGQTDQHVSYQFNMSGSIVQCNISDYDNVCTMTETQQCSFFLDNGFESGSACILLYTRPIPPYLDDPQTTHTIVDVQKRLEILLFSIIPFTTLFVVILAVILSVLCKRYRLVFWKNVYVKNQYTRLN